MINCNELLDYFFESPGLRTFFSVLNNILAAILAGIFVVEITVNNSIDWKLFYKTKSFYALIILTVIIFWYNKSSFNYEREIQKFIDKEYCIAYMRSKCLPEAAKQYRKLIKEGKGGELSQAMKELKEILK